MKSTLIEPPPEFDEGDEDGVTFIRADSVRDLARQTNIGNQDVLDRVLLPGKRFGDYEILGFVAAGGMGEIYAARRILSDGRKSRPVALKVITAEYANDWRIIERFKREARISKAIRSKYVARVYEFGESPKGHAFLSMELLNGEELFDRLHRHLILSPLTVAELTLQILKGLHQIHDTGFVHRDLKPENIFLAHDKKRQKESVKIIDFGIAKRAENESDPLLSVVGQIYGTPQYIAPEQALDPDVDHRADLYSLGVMMYECVTGSLPFEGESSYEIIVAHQTEPVPALPSTVDPEFAQIVYHALAKDPAQRYQSAMEMGRVLKRWLDETSWVEEDEAGLSGEFATFPDLNSPAAPSMAQTRRSEEANNPKDLRQDEPTGQPAADPAEIDTSQDSDARSGLFSLNELDDLTDDPPPKQAAPRSAPNTPPKQRHAPNSPAHDAAAKAAPQPAPQTGEIAAKQVTTSELRSPRATDQNQNVSAQDARKAQIITGVALGLLILAVLYLVFL